MTKVGYALRRLDSSMMLSTGNGNEQLPPDQNSRDSPNFLVRHILLCTSNSIVIFGAMLLFARWLLSSLAMLYIVGNVTITTYFSRRDWNVCPDKTPLEHAHFQAASSKLDRYPYIIYHGQGCRYCVEVDVDGDVHIVGGLVSKIRLRAHEYSSSIDFCSSLRSAHTYPVVWYDGRCLDLCRCGCLMCKLKLGSGSS